QQTALTRQRQKLLEERARFEVERARAEVLAEAAPQLPPPAGQPFAQLLGQTEGPPTDPALPAIERFDPRRSPQPSLWGQAPAAQPAASWSVVSLDDLSSVLSSIDLDSDAAAAPEEPEEPADQDESPLEAAFRRKA
ncbi:MAG: hypothetical protein M3Y59_18640, partial [Myxococcota bacterium]|nr:hypothetical protein [Myxococcota bacterium]